MGEIMAEKEKNPTWKPSDMDANVPVKVKLDCAKPIASGTNKFGEWNMWLGYVENQRVVDADRKTVLPKYSGKVSFFPNEYLNGEFLKATGSAKVGTVVEITLTPKKGDKGFYSSYKVKVVSEGTIPSDQVSYPHNQFINDFSKLVEKKLIDPDKEDFINLGSEAPYKIATKDLEDLWGVYNSTRLGDKVE
jgi:hypothetical protein